ncbi:MAG: hypothetical protein JO131_05995, partial [Gammaproteobacteria bacterium]|nr:hypothetical protein [Gammaproteobacteria bacterium]
MQRQELIADTQAKYSQFKHIFDPVMGLSAIIDNHFTLKLAITAINVIKKRFGPHIPGVTISDIYESYLHKYIAVCIDSNYGSVKFNYYLKLLCKQKKHEEILFNEIELKTICKESGILEQYLPEILHPSVEKNLDPLFEKMTPEINAIETQPIYKIKEKNIATYLLKTNYKPRRIDMDAIREMADEKLFKSEKILLLYSDPSHLNNLINDLTAALCNKQLKKLALEACNNLQELYLLHEDDRIKNCFHKIWENDIVGLKGLQKFREEPSFTSFNSPIIDYATIERRGYSGRLQGMLLAKKSFESFESRRPPP